MIDDTKKYEEMYLNELRKHFSSFDDCKSLDDELNELEVTFRNPNLLIETIQAMQSKHDESLKEIQFKLTEMNQVKVHLKASNKFQPNLSLFNQTEATSLFGLIKMNACWSNVNSFKGQILKDKQEYFQLINLCDLSPNDKWSLLYRGTRDGFDSSDFHSKCDGHSNTLTLLKAKESRFIVSQTKIINLLK
jgi:hypothetical protein